MRKSVINTRTVIQERKRSHRKQPPKDNGFSKLKTKKKDRRMQSMICGSFLHPAHLIKRMETCFLPEVFGMAQIAMDCFKYVWKIEMLTD